MLTVWLAFCAGKINKVSVTAYDHRVTITPDALISWLALPVAPDDLTTALSRARADHGGDPVTDWLLDTADPDKDQREVSEVRLPEPEDAHQAAALLLGRIQLLDHVNEAWNRHREQEGSLPSPSLDVISEADRLASLAAAHADTLGPDLAALLTAAAAAVQTAHALEPVSATSRETLRRAVDGMRAGAPRRWLSWAFGALARRAAEAGRPDLWQGEVGHLIDQLTVHRSDYPADLARAVAVYAAAVVARDSRRERADRTRHQTEMLLDLACSDGAGDGTGDGAGDGTGDGAATDRERLRLALAYLRNDDLCTDSEAPAWVDAADDVVLDLIGRLGYDGVNSTLAECGNLLLATRTPPERITRSLAEWGAAAQRRDMLDLTVASSVDDVVRNLAGGVPAAESPENPAAQRPSPAPLPGTPRGVPAGLYSEDFPARAKALASEVGGWAFTGVLAADDAEFHAALTACAEMYTRGIHDPVEVVREESVIYARRMIAGLGRRGEQEEANRWCRQVATDTAGLSSPRCVRARTIALWDLAHGSADPAESARAFEDAAAALDHNDADYAVCYRARLTGERSAQLPPGPARVAEMVRALDLLVQAEQLEEWEETDWRRLILATAPDVIDEARQVGDAAAMVHCAAVHLDRLERDGGPVPAGQLHVLGYRVRRELAAVPDDVDPGVRSGRDALVARATALLDAATPQSAAFAAAVDRFAAEADRWRADHGHDLAGARAAVLEAAGLLPTLVDEEDLVTGSGGVLAEEVRHLLGETLHAGDVAALSAVTAMYLAGGLYRVDEEGWDMVGSLVDFAAEPDGYLLCRDHDLVREVYGLLEPLVDPRRDSRSEPAFRRNAKIAARRGRGLFRR
jgi:hypothetical protein